MDNFVTHFTFPNRHVYSALAALDYFRDAAMLTGAVPDERVSDAVDLVRSKRQPDGAWLQEYRLAGRTWVDVDAPAGERSKWLTLIGTRVLDWWDSAQ